MIGKSQTSMAEWSKFSVNFARLGSIPVGDKINFSEKIV